MRAALLLVYLSRTHGAAPSSLRADLHLGDGPFVTLDAPFGVGPDVLFTWALPAA
jgi:hypothetical protein